MKDLIIVGAGGFGREVLETVKAINEEKKTWNIKGFIDDIPDALDGYNCQYKVIGTIQEWQPDKNEIFAIAIADPKAKERVIMLLKNKGAEFASIVHPTVTIGENTMLGEGVVIFGCSGISVNVKLGNFVFLNAMVGIGHDVTIGDYCTLGPKCCISGHTVMGQGVNVGALASTYPGVHVGNHATIGMNSAAIRKVKPNTTVIGVPAKCI